MSDFRIPLQNPQPDCDRFVRVMLGKEQPTRPPLVEYIVDPVVMRPILTDMIGRPWVDVVWDDRDSHAAYLDNVIDFWYRLGYDFIRLEIGLGFPTHGLVADDPAPGATGKRGWVDQHHGTITSWDDFETYAWPTIEAMDFFWLEYINDHLPDGMGFISSHGGGVYEHLSAILSYEGLCLLIMDQPDLVAAVADRIGELQLKFYEHLLDLDRLSVVFPGDDMGFRSATLISPNDLVKYTLPWHKRYARMAHEKGLPYFLHSCGNLEAIMPHLINEVGIDGKHSFEDAIVPVTEMYRRYHDRIALLGGVDVNMLTRATPDDLRKYVRGIIDANSDGRYAIGSGNSIPSYIPVENYLTMLDEALR